MTNSGKSASIFERRKQKYPPAPWDRRSPYFVGATPIVVLLLLAPIGLFATGFLTYRHIVLTSHTGTVGDSALCKAGSVINCDGILVTDYSVLFGYFPSSVLGLMGFTLVVWVLLNILLNQHLRKLGFVILIFYFCTAIGFSWYYIYIMIFDVDFICTWCIVVHIVNFLSLLIILVVAITKRKQFLLEEPAGIWERFYFVAGALILPWVIFFGSGYIENYLSFQDAKLKYEEIANDPVVIMATLKNSPSYEIPIGPEDPIFGNPKAPHPIVLFSDFQCPLCSQTEDYLKKLVALNPEMLSLVYKNYPLSTECNSFLLGNLHPHACDAAKAAYAAFVLKGSGGFWQYSDLLFANQKSLKTSPWLDYAIRIGLDKDKFLKLMEPEQAPQRKLRADTDLGAQLKLSATPQIFFEGRNIPQNFKGEFLIDILEEMVRSKYPDKQDFKLKRTP